MLADWPAYMAMASQVVGRFHGQFRHGRFEYLHPVSLQPDTPPRRRKPYPVSIAYTEWGPAEAPVLLCCGGVANVAMRFNYLAADLADRFRVVCMDWAGRGRSGWLSSQGDYSLESHVEQLRQMVAHLGDRPLALLGSSMGGSAALELAARWPQRVERLVLNDVGPAIPAARRRRRAQVLARHYVFRTPQDLLRRAGASQKNDGPLPDDIRFNLTFHQTRWSDEDGGRIYRHDVRAMQAYRDDARHSLQQWRTWRQVRCPVLLIHGQQSDALTAPIIERMQRTRPEHPLAVMHVPDTGHTPLLADRNHTWYIRQWLAGATGCVHGHAHWSVLHAPLRQRYPGHTPRLAPAAALVR